MGTKYEKSHIPRQKRKNMGKFIDECYYGMTCVRCLDTKKAKKFNAEMSFHFDTNEEATQFEELIKKSR